MTTTSATAPAVPGGPVGTIHESHLPWDLQLDGRVAPRTGRFALGDSWVVGCRIGPMAGRRRSGELRRTPGEFVAVLLVERGTEVLVQQGRTAEVRAGGAALWDGVRPVECSTAGGLSKRTLFVPREVLADVVPDVASVTARVLAPSANLRLLGSWLTATARQTDLDDPTRATAGRMALDLLRTALARSTGAPGASQEVLVLQVKDYVDRHLSDPGLTLDAVARANAISVRYLHLLFRGSGETAAEYVRRRRLERAQLLLLGPGRDLSIAEVATRSGFDSPSSFSRAYRGRYGTTPRDARRDRTPA